jgi:hypothetical protein
MVPGRSDRRHAICFRRGQIALKLDVWRMRVLREIAAHSTIAAAPTALDFTPSAVSQLEVRRNEQAAHDDRHDCDHGGALCRSPLTLSQAPQA